MTDLVKLNGDGRPRKKPGPKPYTPTAALRRQVSVAAGGGMSHDDIALALRVSKPTLYKYFAADLAEGAAGRRIEVLDALYKAAIKGSVSACKGYLAVAPSIAAPPERPEPDGEEKGAPLGKKERANAEAKTAQVGSDWEDDLAPRARRTLQ